jgi:hypothetical protein
MILFGKRLSDYTAFCRMFLIVIPVIGIGRLALSLGGAPNSTARWLSMTVMAWIAVIYYSVRVHTSGFGSYKQLLPIFALLNLSAQVIAIAGIAIAIFSGNNNVFSSPEFAFGSTERPGRTCWLTCSSEQRLVRFCRGSSGLVSWR